MIRVTINTDASYSKSRKYGKLGGFAFWIKCDYFTYKGSGIIKSPENSSDAELKAIANALYMLKKNRNIKRIDRLFINTDSTYCIERIKRKNKDDVTDLIWEIINSYDGAKKVDCRHVKAHLHTKTPRHYINDWCDQMAKIEMKKQRV